MRVLFLLAGDETTASTRYRVLELLPYLEEAGVECICLSPTRIADRIPGPDIIGYGVSLLLLVLRCWRYDAIYLQKIPLPTIYIHVLNWLVDVVIYDFDDALYTTPSWESGNESKWSYFLPGTLQSVTAVVTGNPVLAEYALQYSNRVYCLPTGIPAERYHDNAHGNTDDDTVVIGWIGNPANLHYLNSIDRQLREVLDKHENVRLSVITSGDLPLVPLNDRRGKDVAYPGWSIKKELELLAEVDVAIRPLFDDEWTRAKGGFTSVVQTMALGIPVVVTPVTMLEDIIEHGESGFHAENGDDWIRYLDYLIKHPEQRLVMGTQAAKAIDREGLWSENRANKLIAILEKECSINDV